MDINDIYRKFIREEYDSKGILTDFDLVLPDNFNFSYDILDVIGENFPDRTALIWTNDKGCEKIFTYGDLIRYINRTANMLTAHGVKKGDRVMLALKRHYQIYFIVPALHKIGAAAVPVTSQLRKKDYIYRFNACRAKYIIASSDPNVTGTIEDAMCEYDGISEKFTVNGKRNGWSNFDDEIMKYSDVFSERIETDINDDMLLFFSSGTTGEPKLIVHGFHYASAHIFTAKHWHRLTPDSVHLSISDSGWAKFFWGKMYGQLALGCTLFVYDFERFIPRNILSMIKRYKITSLCCPPTMYRFFIKEGLEKYDLSSVECATTAGEAIDKELFRKFYEITGLKLSVGYGQSETVVAVCSRPGEKLRPGSLGKPVPLYDIVLADENDTEVSVGKQGEICIRLNKEYNYGLFKYYENNSDITECGRRNDLYHTGDIAYQDNDGYFWYVGRKDDVIKSSGYRIGPVEIESVLMDHPAVREAAVTAVPDKLRRNVVKATIVLNDTYKDNADDDLKQKLQIYVKNATAPYKYPRIIEFVDELPKTSSGKIRRSEIRKSDIAFHLNSDTMIPV